MSFFSKLNFSSTNEDGATEITALQQAKRILCLTGTGTRAFDLLLTDASEVVALDSNPVQNALLALKVGAMEALGRDEYLAFLGVAPSSTRRDVYQAIRHRLDPRAQEFWDRHFRLIVQGVWHAGEWERLLRWNARFLAVFRRGAVDQLMSATSTAEQAAIWERRFNSGTIGRVIEGVGRDLVWRMIMREPAARHLPSARQVSQRIETDFAHAARSFLFAQNDIATLALQGRHHAAGALPVHLRAENYTLVRESLSRLRPLVGDLSQLAKLEAGQFDGFSLSDFGSYCGPQDYADCWQAILATAVPGAAFCERIFMNEMAPPTFRVSIDEDRSARLSASDRSIIYRVRVGTIDAVAQ